VKKITPTLNVQKTLRSIPWFIEVTNESLNNLAHITELHQFNKDEHIFIEGDRTDFLYIVLEGRVRIENHIPTKDDIEIYTAEPLDIFGWSSMTPVVRQRTASAKAIENAVVIAFKAESLNALCENDHYLGFVIMRRLSNIIASRLLSTRIQLFDTIIQDNK
jgi:CRP-like cAMP-binding protein